MDVDADHQTTGAVIGAAIAVHRELGPGLDEKAYEASLALKLHSLHIAHTCQAPLRIDYRGASLDCGYRYDLLIDARLPIELKAVEQILPIHQAQLLTYMRMGSHPLGLLINFDVPVLKEGIQRMALTRLPPAAAVYSVDHGVHLDVASAEILTPVVFGSTMVALGGLGMLAAHLGGAPLWRGAARVTFWGAIAMVSTALIGKLVGSPV